MCDLLLQPLPFCIVMLPLSEPVQSHACALQGVATAETFFRVHGRGSRVSTTFRDFGERADSGKRGIRRVCSLSVRGFGLNGSRLMQGVCDYYMI